MPPHYIFEMNRVGKRYGEKVVLQNISLMFYYGAKIGIVGENGAGKSTLLKIMAGIDKDFEGETKLAKGMTVRYVAQEPELDLDATVRENLMTALKPITDKIDRFNEISILMGDPDQESNFDKLMEEMGELQEAIDAVDGWNLDHQIDLAADALVLPPDDAIVRKLSGGERRRVALCMALLEKPDLLLLDEPTNHLDVDAKDELKRALKAYKGSILMVCHEPDFYEDWATRVIDCTKWTTKIF